MKVIKEYLDIVAMLMGCAIVFLTGIGIVLAAIKALIVMWNVVF